MLTAKQPAFAQDPDGQALQPSLAGSRNSILAQVSTRAERDLVVIDRLRKAIVAGLAPPQPENDFSIMTAALLRWDDDGGHPAMGARAVKPTRKAV